MRISNLLLFSIISLGTLSLKAQTNLLEGYYITNDQDTIHGYIDYRSEKRNFTVCVFSASKDTKPIKLYPDNIFGFVVDNKDYYERHAVKNRKGEELYGFFKTVLKGKLSLLRYQSRYFVKTLDGEIFEISKRSEVSQGKISVDYYGLGLLKILMKGCREISEDFLENEYKSEPNFLMLFRKYNLCVNGSFYEYEKIRILPHIELGLQLSSTINYLQLSPAQENVEFEKFSFNVGCFASIFIPKVNENIRLVLEPSYGKIDLYSFYNKGNTNNDLIINYSALKFPVIIRYNFNRLFFDIGIQNQFVLNQYSRWRVETVQQSIIYTTEQQITSFDAWDIGYLAGVGFRFSLASYPVRPSIRFSQIQSHNHPNRPNFQLLELNISMQLTK